MDRVKRLISRLDAWTLRRRLPRITRRAIFGFLEHDALTYAGSMAYFGVLSLFQLLVLGIVVLSHILGEGAARDFVIEQVVAATPLDAETVGGVIDATIEARGTMTIVSFGFLLFGALGIFSALANGISLAFENVPRRPFLQHQLVGLLLIGLTGLLALASFAIGIVTGILQSTASDLAADLPGRETAVWLVGFGAPILLIFVAFWVIYRVAPNRNGELGRGAPRRDRGDRAVDRRCASGSPGTRRASPTTTRPSGRCRRASRSSSSCTSAASSSCSGPSSPAPAPSTMTSAISIGPIRASFRCRPIPFRHPRRHRSSRRSDGCPSVSRPCSA